MSNSNIVGNLDKAIEEAKARIPSHLDSETLVACALDNASDASAESVIEVFQSTVDMYIDQNEFALK